MTSFDDAHGRNTGYLRQEIVKGHWQSVQDDLCDEISNMIVGGGIHTMWIGICSNGESGLRDRWNRKYKALGMKWIIPIYETSSDASRKAMEQAVIARYQGTRFVLNGTLKIENVVAGGGGPQGSPPYFLYVAFDDSR
jgi:hypothetical protein